MDRQILIIIEQLFDPEMKKKWVELLPAHLDFWQ